MTIKLQGKWEPLKIAEVLHGYADGWNCKWAEDCAKRIEAQVNGRKEKERL